MPADITGTEVIQEDKATGDVNSSSFRVPCLPMSCWQTKSTERHRRHKLLCWRPCRNIRSQREVSATSCPIRSSYWPRKIPSSRREHIPPRSPARPLHVRDPRGLSHRRGRIRDRPADDRCQSCYGRKVLSYDEWLNLQALVRRVPVADSVIRYAMQFARLTRVGPGQPDFVKQYVSWGAGPRASQYLIPEPRPARFCMDVLTSVSKTYRRSPLRYSAIAF